MRDKLVVMAVLGMVLGGCGSDGGTALGGIYMIQSWTHNPDSCAAEGPPAQEGMGKTLLFVKHDNFLGHDIVTATDCDDLADCRMKVADDTLYFGDFAFDSGGDGSGWKGDGHFLSSGGTAMCSGTVSAYLMTGEKGVSITVREEIKSVTDVPKDSDGFCDDDKAKTQAAPKACEKLTVVKAMFLE